MRKEKRQSVLSRIAKSLAVLVLVCWALIDASVIGLFAAGYLPGYEIGDLVQFLIMPPCALFLVVSTPAMAAGVIGANI